MPTPEALRRAVSFYDTREALFPPIVRACHSLLAHDKCVWV